MKRLVKFIILGSLTLLIFIFAKGLLSDTIKNPKLSNPATVYKTVTSEVYKWQAVKIGGGGFVTGMVIHPIVPDLIYARTDVGGLFRFQKSEQIWQQLNFGSIESVAIDPQNPDVVYIANGAYTQGDKGVIQKSINRGKTWKTLSLSLPMGGNEQWRWTGERLAVDPNNSQVIYFASRLNGLWRSKDGGNLWQQIPPDQIPVGQVFPDMKQRAGVTFVTFDPSSGKVNGNTKIVYVGVAGEGIYRSTDGGKAWHRASGDRFEQLVPQQGKVNTKGEFFTTFYRSVKDPRGSVWKFSLGSWQEITPKPNKNYSALALSPANPNTLFVVTYPMTPNDLYRSTDGGKTWETLKNSLSKVSWWPKWSFFTLTGAIALSPQHPQQAWLTNGIGVWKTENALLNQVSWTATVNGIEETVTFDALSSSIGQPLITAIADFDGFRHQSLDVFPTNNHSQGSFTTTTGLANSAGHPEFMVAVGGSHQNSKLVGGRFSQDSGKTWRNFASIERGNHPADLVFGNVAVSATDTKNIVWQPSNHSLPYFTQDGGQSWQKSSFFETKMIRGGAHTHLWNRQQALAADTVREGTFYLYHFLQGMLRSDDGGKNWKIVCATLPTNVWKGANVETVMGMEGEVWISLKNKGLYRSQDFGRTFAAIASVEDAQVLGFGKSAQNQIYPTVFIVGKVRGQTGVFRSIDRGKNWLKIADTPNSKFYEPHVLVGDSVIFGKVYLGTNGNGFIYGMPAK